MKHRTALATVLAAASLLATAGIAQASHGHEDTNYSPCRPDDSAETRVGYHDDADADSINHQLPTIYAKGEGSGGYIGICSGNSYGHPGQPPAQFIQVGSEAPYVTHSDEPSVPAAAISPAPKEGQVIVGDDSVEVDGTKGNTGSQAITYLDGYVYLGASGGDPQLCMAGDYSHEEYQDPATYGEESCNEQLLADAGDELG